MAGYGAKTPGRVAFAKPNFYWLKIKIGAIIFLSISLIYNPTPGWVKMGWVGLGPRIFDLPNVGLGTYFRQPNLPNNPLGQGNPSGRPYRAGTLLYMIILISSIKPEALVRSLILSYTSRRSAL